MSEYIKDAAEFALGVVEGSWTGKPCSTTSGSGSSSITLAVGSAMGAAAIGGAGVTGTLSAGAAAATAVVTTQVATMAAGAVAVGTAATAVAVAAAPFVLAAAAIGGLTYGISKLFEE